MRQYYVTAHFTDGHTAVYTFLFLDSAIKFVSYLWAEAKNLKFVTMTSTANH